MLVANEIYDEISRGRRQRGLDKERRAPPLNDDDRMITYDADCAGCDM